MTRAMVFVLLATSVAGSVAADETIFEDAFDGPTLDAAWIRTGGGSYSLIDGDLEFVTEQGDYTFPFEQAYGLPRHGFYVDPGDALRGWSAVTRVRYNTPDQMYEQVALIAYRDDDNFAKLAYNYGVVGTLMGFLIECGDTSFHAGAGAIPVQTDYFWMRMDRVGDDYTVYWSPDTTTDPEAVSWIYINTVSADLGDDPWIGIAGFNTDEVPSGELAEFDYFRLTASDSVETATLTVTTNGPGAVQQTPDKTSFQLGETVTLKAIPLGRCDQFMGWWGSVSSTETEITVVMDADKAINATFYDGEAVTSSCLGLSVCQIGAMGLGFALLTRPVRRSVRRGSMHVPDRQRRRNREV